MIVNCPQCGKKVEFSTANRYRPFCSERCSTLDLGAWADEKYRVPIERQDEQETNTVNDNSGTEDDASQKFPSKNQLN